MQFLKPSESHQKNFKPSNSMFKPAFEAKDKNPTIFLKSYAVVPSLKSVANFESSCDVSAKFQKLFCQQIMIGNITQPFYTADLIERSQRTRIILGFHSFWTNLVICIFCSQNDASCAKTSLVDAQIQRNLVKSNLKGIRSR